MLKGIPIPNNTFFPLLTSQSIFKPIIINLYTIKESKPVSIVGHKTKTYNFILFFYFLPELFQSRKY